MIAHTTETAGTQIKSIDGVVEAAAAVAANTEFALEAIGIEGRGRRHTGAATHAEHYKKFVEDRVREILGLFTQRSDYRYRAAQNATNQLLSCRYRPGSAVAPQFGYDFGLIISSGCSFTTI